MMYPLITLAADSTQSYFVGVYVVGFIAAVVIGSIAWYNSKRPVGWEDKDKPDFLPKVGDDQQE